MVLKERAAPRNSSEEGEKKKGRTRFAKAGANPKIPNNPPRSSCAQGVLYRWTPYAGTPSGLWRAASGLHGNSATSEKTGFVRASLFGDILLAAPPT